MANTPDPVIQVQVCSVAVQFVMCWIMPEADVEESASKPSLRGRQVVDSAESNLCILIPGKLAIKWASSVRENILNARLD